MITVVAFLVVMLPLLQFYLLIIWLIWWLLVHLM